MYVIFISDGCEAAFGKCRLEELRFQRGVGAAGGEHHRPRPRPRHRPHPPCCCCCCCCCNIIIMKV